MDIEENKKLGLFLKQVQNNIEKDKNYTIEESFLEAVSNLSDESKNIFFHDIAIDYISLGSLNYIECLKQIKNLNDIPYANAQHILGHDSLKIGNLEGALDYLIKVNDVDHDIYLNAQIDLAIVKEKLGNVDDAINIYQDIISKTDENDKIYAKAQQNLGSIYVDKKSYEHAEECFRKILSIHSACFADAQFGLGVIFAVRKQDLKAVDYYKNVSNEFTRTYSKARFNLGNIYHRLNREDLALRCYKEVHESEATLYLQAKYSIANIYLSLRNLEEAFFSLKEIPEKSEIYLYFHYQIEMILTIGHLNDKEKQNKYLNLINLIKIILKLLFVNSEFDTSIAHYTNLTVSKILLDAPQQKNPSLRLGMINFMNDPTEGGLLNEILKIDHNIKTDELAFISCFTLHHDSLNQFRLYSKENQQEATGLSLIFSRNFFETNFNAFGMINKINPQASKLEIKESKKENEQKIGLYRCIYLDHISGLIKVAQREEWSFHREYKKENKAWQSKT